MEVRRLVLLSLALVTALATAGCNASALSKRELVVYFTPSASTAQHHAALVACEHVTTEATPEPFSTSGPASNQVGDVRFRIDHADDRAIAQLEDCLQKQPGVVGVDQPDLTD